MDVLKKITKIHFILLFFIILQSCGGAKLSNTNKISPSSKITETFYIGDGITQYHIKKQELTSNYDNSDNEFDLTFRVNDSENKLCTVNFTVISNFEINSNAKLNIESNSKPISNVDLTVIYTEKFDNKIINRVSAKVNFNNLIKALNTDTFSFKFYNSDNSIILKPTSKTLKNFKEIPNYNFN